MRQFRLTNAKGETLDLMDKTAYFNAPSGLGMSRNIDSMLVGTDWMEIDSEIEQQAIPGEMVFKGYDQYSAFVRFCAAGPLTFHYKPRGKWYYRKCNLQLIEKGEIDPETRMLRCPVEFLCVTLWYEQLTVRYAENSGEAGKEYDYTYDYTYTEASAGSVIVENTELVESPCALHIAGPVINPSWSVIEGGGVVSRGKVNYTIPEGNKLVINSSPSEMQIAEYTMNNEYVGNLYRYSDFSTTRFITLRPGSTTISFSQEGTGEIVAWVEVRLLATTV